MKPTSVLLAASGALLFSAAAAAADRAPLPPEPPWSGQSRSLQVGPDDPWITPAEKSGLTRTPRYDETVAWLQRLVAASPDLRMESLGVSPEGRDLWMVIASRDPDPAQSTRPTLFALAGIHAGEIDGKDAGLMLLRDLTVGGTRRDLLDGANFLFVPIFNVDGHERFTPYGRMNQRGPVESGGRVTARRRNLNRDWAKLDTPEVRAVVAALRHYDPELLLDLHVTDGLDYQYDITFGFQGTHAYSPAINGWLEAHLRPAWNRDLASMGHTPGPLTFPRNYLDRFSDLAEWTGSPRFSDGYGTARHLPTVLVENHSLKSYDRRVLGTYVALESSLRLLAHHGDGLRAAITADRARRPAEVVLTWNFPETTDATITIAGMESRQRPSPAAGRTVTEWTGQPVDLEFRLWRRDVPGATARRPVAYWIPPAWTDAIETLQRHGIRMERVANPPDGELEWYRIAGAALEPAASDSLFRWGFFLESLQRVEYAEEYVLAPLADQMLEEDNGDISFGDRSFPPCRDSFTLRCKMTCPQMKCPLFFNLSN